MKTYWWQKFSIREFSLINIKLHKLQSFWGLKRLRFKVTKLQDTKLLQTLEV